MVVFGDWDWYKVTSRRWCGVRPVVSVPSRRCLGGRLLEFESLIGREDNPASDALLDRHVPCPAQGREAGSEAHHGRFFLGSWARNSIGDKVG